MAKKIEKFVLSEYTNNLYKKEAGSSIALTRDVADKINELVDAFNSLENYKLEKIHEQDGKINKAVIYMKDNLLYTMNELMNILIARGVIDDKIAEHINGLNERLNNLLGSVTEGSTTLDSEIIDLRVAYHSIITYLNSGESVREQIRSLAFLESTKEFPDTIELEMVDGEYFNNTINGRISKADTMRRSKYVYPVREGTMFISPDKIKNDNMMIICFDENYQRIGHFYVTKSGINPEGNHGCILEGTKFFGLNVYTTNTSEKITLKVIKPDLQTIEFPYDKQDVNYILYPKYWMSGSGALSSADNFNLFVLPINKEYEKVYINVNFQHNAVFFDGNNQFISSGTEFEEVFPMGRIYTIPENASFIGITLSSSYYYGTETDKLSGSATFIKKNTKKILCIGDSITYLDGRIGADFDGSTYLYGYQSYLRKHGYLVTTLGVSGASYTKNSEGKSLYEYVVTDALDVTGYDHIVLMGSLNDIRLNLPLGSDSVDYKNPNLDTTTFNGALGSIIKYIRTNNPTAKIYLCTNLQSESDNRPYERANSFREAIIHNGEFYGCTLIDLFKDMNVSPFINFSELFYDNTHPNYKGLVRIGEIVKKAIIE